MLLKTFMSKYGITSDLVNDLNNYNIQLPNETSGWYLPSIYQFDYLWNKTYFNDGNMLASVEDTLVMLSELGYADEMYVVDSEYWSSTEKYDSYGDSSVAYYFCFDKAMYQPGFGTHLNKYWAVRVRSMLTF